jgi:hypothetical protein
MHLTRRSGTLALLVLVVVAAALLVSAGAAIAAPPPVVDGSDGSAFLCPAVGKGVLHHRPDAGALPNDNFTFLPGHNQAGAHANPNAFNTLGPPDSPGPGNGNTDWSPIWPPAGPG